MNLMRSRVIQVIWLILILVFIVVALGKNWSVIRDYDWRQVQLASLLLALVTTVVRKFTGAVRWAWIIELLGNQEQNIPLRKSLRIFFISSLATYIPGTYWFIPGRIIMNSRFGVKSLQTGVSTVLEQFLIVASGGLVSILGLDLITSKLNLPGSSTLWLLIVIIGGLISIHPSVLQFVTRLIARVFKLESFTLTLSYRQALLLLIWSMVVWFVSGLSLLYLAQVFSPQITLTQTGVFTAIYAVSFLIGYFVPFAPGGLGVREAAMSIGLTAMGVPPALVIIVAALSRLLIVFEDLFWAGVSLLL